MAKELIKRVVDEQTYEFQQFGAKHSLKILTRITKIVGEPLTVGMSAMGLGEEANKGKKLLDRKIDSKLLGDAVRTLCSKLDEDEVLNLVMELTANDNVLCEGRKISFDSHYEGKLGHLFKVVAAAVEVQYGDFFGEMIAMQG